MVLRERNFTWAMKTGITLFFALFLFTGITLAQRTVTGTLADQSTGEPLIGASVIVKGTANGTITDIDGNYSLQANNEDVLVFSYVGFTDSEVVVGDQSVINFGMSQGVLVDEVVVTGYSTQRERDITGAVAVVKADELNEVTATNFAQKLEGKVTGVTINNSGEPGSGTSVRIRGISSFNNSNPLYIIDGVPTTDQFQNGINPNDIESIQVLKDASAASIYGARANNGVIIITTKKGQKGKTKFTYDATIGSAAPIGRYDLIKDPKAYSEVVWTSFENSSQGSIPAEVPYAAGRGVIPDFIYAGDYSGYPAGRPVNEDNYSYPDNLIMRSNPEGTDWWDEVFNPAMVMEHTLGVSGGGDNSTFAMSFGYLDQNGTMIHTDFDRFSIRANSAFDKGRWTAGENFTFSRSTGIFQDGGNQSEQNTMTQILKAQSIIPVFDIAGNFAGGKANGLSNGGNPVAAQERAKDNRGTFYKALGNAYVGFEVVPGLRLRSSIGMEFFMNQTGGFNFPTWEESEPNVTNQFNEQNQSGFNWTWTNTATYSTTFDGVHDINALVGYEAIRGSGRTIGGGLGNYFTTDINAWYLNTGLGAPDSRSVFSNGGFNTLASSFAKVDYSYDDTYIFSATIRRDGSSNFGEAQRYGIFPAVSVGYRLSNALFPNHDIIDDLKVRAGYGITGNQSIPGGNTVNRFGGGPGTSFYDINGTNNSLATGYALTNRGNEDTKWEENTSLNFGIDGSLYNGKIDFVLDVYNRTTDGLLFNVTLPATAGSAAPPFVNIAKMTNKGIDFAINYRNKASKDFGYNIGLNLSAYRNEIQEIDGERTEFFANNNSSRIGETGINQLGGPIGVFYGWQTDGIFASQAEVDAHAEQVGKGVGQFRLKDLNEDGIINDGDLGNIGSPHPDFTLGMNLGVNFGDIDITTFWVGSVGNDIYNYNKLFEVFRFFNSNVRTDLAENSWSPSNLDGIYPLINEDDIFSENSTDFYVEDGSYLRMRTIQLGYTLGGDMLEKAGIGSARVYLQGQNLLTITGYSGIDPALSSFSRGDQRRGFDYGNYPSSKMIQAGLNVSF